MRRPPVLPATVLSLLLTIFQPISGPDAARAASGPSAASERGAISTFTADLGGDLRGLAGWENALWLSTGALATWGAFEIEDPAGARRALGGGPVDPLADGANVYADIRLQAPLTLTIWGWGHGRDHERTEALGYDLTRALLIRTAIVRSLKLAVGRTRPDGGDYSFPSGHVSTAFTVAGVVSRHAGRGWTAAAIGAGCLTALGRLEESRHYASDTVAGATIGWIVGRAAGRRSAASPDESAWRLEPGRGGLVLSRRF